MAVEINYSLRTNEIQCSIVLRKEMSFYLKLQHLAPFSLHPFNHAVTKYNKESPIDGFILLLKLKSVQLIEYKSQSRFWLLTIK